MKIHINCLKYEVSKRIFVINLLILIKNKKIKIERNIIFFIFILFQKFKI